MSTGPDADYAAVSDTVTFNMAESRSPPNDPLTVNDALDEDEETFFANLSSPSSGTITDNQAVGTINDDDPLPVVSINNASGERGRGGQFHLTLTPGEW